MTSMNLSTYQRLDYEAMLGPGIRESGEKRLYEMCMVFKHKTSKHVEYEEEYDQFPLGRVLNPPSAADKSKMDMWKHNREAVLKGLQSCGLQCFCFFNRDRDEVYCKIGADAAKLRDIAALIKHKLQLKTEYLDAYAEFRHDFPGRPEMNFTDRRVVSHMYKTHAGDDYPGEDAIFTTLDKILLIHHIITSKDKDCAGINVGSLVHKQELLAYFPLHESQRLHEIKASIYDWIMMGHDHTTKVREYFGDKIAYYFLWLSFYWKWLVPVSIVGLCVQLIDFMYQTPDNFTAIGFCVLMSIWSTFLPHFWRRQEAKYAIAWGSFDMEAKLEPCRAMHWGEPRLNPVTAQVEPHYPWQSRLRNYAFSLTVIIFSGVLLVGAILLILLAEIKFAGDSSVSLVMYQFGLAAAVQVLNAVLSVVANELTIRENHRSQTEHDNNRLAKILGLKFLNSYFALYYIAFLRKKPYSLFGSEVSCYKDDCMVDLRGQLGAFVFFRITISNLIEVGKPRLKSAYHNMRTGQGSLLSWLQGHNQPQLADMSPAEKQAKQDVYSSFEEFDEALVTHGYATLFAASAPWVCAATLISIIVETWVDMKAVTEQKQRAMPRCSKNNEPWTTAFTLYGVLAAFTNIFLLVFGTHEYDGNSLTEKLVLFLFLEHIVFASSMIVKQVFPAIPKSVELMKLKQETVVHRCLENIKGDVEQDYTVFRDNRAVEFDVFENDQTEIDAEMAEPSLSMAESGRTLYDGVMETLPKRKS